MTAGRERSVSGDGVQFASVKAALQITAQLHVMQTVAFKTSRTGSLEGNIDEVLSGIAQR
jgi:hypothetical protein